MTLNCTSSPLPLLRGGLGWGPLDKAIAPSPIPDPFLTRGAIALNPMSGLSEKC
ncbi:hypothetical protein NG791_24550 [Laspinema sp. D1]|uniref:hypothetical protein n=1 Tax=Laspinema palackyanum TaxID=3231601 RepID=UPI00348B7BC4|nr:hypothetical protein [Laspinema sp. D2b]